VRIDLNVAVWLGILSRITEHVDDDLGQASGVARDGNSTWNCDRQPVTTLSISRMRAPISPPPARNVSCDCCSA
jgi:hypothetical protein